MHIHLSLFLLPNLSSLQAQRLTRPSLSPTQATSLIKHKAKLPHQAAALI